MRNVILIAIFAFLAPFAMAQNISFTCEAPLSVGSGQRFQVQFMLRNGGEGTTFSPPKFDGLEVLAGPSVSSGQQMQFAHGVQTSESWYSYTYFVQASASASKATISVASITANGKRYSTKPVTIDISASGGSGTSGGGGGGSSSGTTHMRPGNSVDAKDVLLRMELSKTSVYKGEAVSAQLKLYTRTGIAGLDKAKYPAFNGLWAQEIAVAQNVAPTRSTIAGKVYECHILRQWLLYPQKTGAMEIEQAGFTAYVQVVTHNSSGSLFDNLFGGNSSVQNVEKALVSPPVKLTVKSLPTSDMPLGFALAVGRFDLKGEISASQIATNAAGSLKVTLSGTGDFPLIEAPALTMPAGIEQYDVKMTEVIKNSLAGTSGSRTWEFPFVARSEGDFEIPSVEIPYFDPATATYTTLRTQPYQLHVVRDSTSNSSVSVVGGVSKEELQLLGQDIRYIKTAPVKLTTKGQMWLYSGTFFMTLVLIIASFVVLLWFLRRQINLRADVVGRKHRRASRVALKRLKTAKGFMASGDRGHFFEAMLSAMWGFVGDKFAMELSELSKERIAQQFAERGYSDELCAEFLSIVDDCEIARYAPSVSVDMHSAYDRALQLFDSL